MQQAAGQAFIKASPEAVYDLVSDVTRTGEWSNECVRCEWLGPDEALPGARFRGYNKIGTREWTTEAVVEVADRGREFRFVTERDGLPRSRWSFVLEPSGEGTIVKHTFQRVTPPPIPVRVIETFVLSGGRGRHNRRNIAKTLDQLRAILEP